MKTITFYSFKGGVGRTALLTNLGVYWATQGKVVVLMDLDLAAPGLSYSPLLGDYLNPQGRGLGMADLFKVFRSNAADQQDEISFIPPHYLMREMVLPAGRVTNGRLLAITAGAFPLGQPVNRPSENDDPIPSRNPTDETPEQNAFRSLAESLRSDLEAWRAPPDGPNPGRAIDYLLVDARTGFSELRDLSLGYLADHMVLVSGLNHQNLRGLELTLNALQHRRVPLDEFPINVSVVFSPVPAEDESVIHALTNGKRAIADSLRLASSGRKELAPLQYQLHYTALLATSDRPPMLDYPQGNYSQEVIALAKALEENLNGKTSQSELAQATKKQALDITDTTGTVSPLPKIQTDLPNPMADLPAWHWPYDADNAAQLKGKLLAGLSAAPGVELDKEEFLDKLAWSISLSGEEKQQIMASLPMLSQHQVNELENIFVGERTKFLQVSSMHYKELVVLQLQHARAWANVLLKDNRLAIASLYDALSRKDSPLPNWLPIPDTWGFLARELLNDGMAEEARLSLAQGIVHAKSPALMLDAFLDNFDPKTTPANRWNAAMSLAQTVFDADPWLQFHAARYWLLSTPKNSKAAEPALLPLLQHPPQDPEQCYRLAALVLDELPTQGRETEAALRRAVAISPGKAPYWHSLGNLLQYHLERFEEAEQAYRQAIALDAKNARYWGNLGILLENHLERYEEAEQAYRQAIALDAKNARYWYNLGILLKSHLGRYEEAEQAYRLAIALDAKDARHWNGLGNLLTNYLARHDEAEQAYLTGLELKDPDTTPYLATNLGHFYLLRGKRDRALPYLRLTLEGCADKEHLSGYGLLLALELNDAEAVARQREKVEHRIAAGEEKPYAWAMLLDALVDHDAGKLALWRERAWAALESHDKHFDLINDIYHLCGMRAEAREAGRALVAELLTQPPELIGRFRDQPKGEIYYARFQPFAAGRSYGAGDPADLAFFTSP
ncbi:MAG: tetratricopeptide repeat protein [Sulfuricellaceae bacterium]